MSVDARLRSLEREAATDRDVWLRLLREELRTGRAPVEGERDGRRWLVTLMRSRPGAKVLKLRRFPIPAKVALVARSSGAWAVTASKIRLLARSRCPCWFEVQTGSHYQGEEHYLWPHRCTLRPSRFRLAFQGTDELLEYLSERAVEWVRLAALEAKERAEEALLGLEKQQKSDANSRKLAERLLADWQGKLDELQESEPVGRFPDTFVKRAAWSSDVEHAQVAVAFWAEQLGKEASE